MPSIYLVNPATELPGFHSSEAFRDAEGGWAAVADLAIATVAALAPSTWSVRLADEAIAPADPSPAETFVGITGKVSQRQRMIELAAYYRRLGKVVIIGGSFASLSPEDMRPHADILVRGEIEEIAAGLFEDLERGDWRAEYDGGQADIRRSPLPRWDLYPLGRALSGALQTTRGCPFQCEFCDVIQYQGRKQRHKDLPQILAELDQLHALGVRDVFLVDDNFTVHRKWAFTVLEAIGEWNAAQAEPVRFLTQASLDVARDEAMLQACCKAGLTTLFVGVETINVESLRETGKRQNLLLPIREAIDRIVSAGVAVQAGIIVGFDHDGPETFEAMELFLADAPLPDLSIGVLTAPAQTDLHRRLRREGRLTGEVWNAAAGVPFSTNIVPKGMTGDALVRGVRDLCETVYAPAAYEARLMAFLRQFPGGGEGAPARGPSARSRMVMATLAKCERRGPAEAAMVRRVLRAGLRKPAAMPAVLQYLTRYEQARHVLDTLVETSPQA